MNTLALIAFLLWAAFMRFLPKIMEFIKLKQWAENIPGPTIGELIENAKKGRMLVMFFFFLIKYELITKTKTFNINIKELDFVS